MKHKGKKRTKPKAKIRYISDLKKVLKEKEEYGKETEKDGTPAEAKY